MPKQNILHGVYFYLTCPNAKKEIVSKRHFIFNDGKILGGFNFKSLCHVQKKKRPLREAENYYQKVFHLMQQINIEIELSLFKTSF